MVWKCFYHGLNAKYEQRGDPSQTFGRFDSSTTGITRFNLL